jgi:hypothetical protein
MNTVRANITSSRYAETNSIFQYDTGRKLEIYGCNLPKSVEVQFSTDKEKGNTITRVGNTNNGVTTTIIPNQLLNDSEKTSNFCIFAFLYNVDNDGGRTEYVIKIPVVARPKPENPSEEPLPEPNIFHETVVAVNASADRAEKAASDAEDIRDNLNLDLSEKITRPQTAEVGQVLAVKEIDESGKPTVFEAEDVKVPTKTSELENDSGFLTEHQDISGKLDKEKLPEAIDDALAQAKESGEFNGKDGAPGEKGEKGDPGETTYVENPYDDTEIKKEIAAKVGYSEVVGNQLLMYADDTKEKLLATLKLPSGGSNLDIQINGQSIVRDGVAEIPLIKESSPGLVSVDYYATTGGLTKANEKTGLIRVFSARKTEINNRSNDCLPITSPLLDYAVKAAMCDGKGGAWTAEEQANARDRIGIDEYEDVLDVTLEEDSSFSADFEHEYKQLYIYIDQSGVTEKIYGVIFLYPYSYVDGEGKKINTFCSYYQPTSKAYSNVASVWKSYGKVATRIASVTNDQKNTTGNQTTCLKVWDTSMSNINGIGDSFKGIYPSTTIFKAGTRLVVKGVRA